MPEEMAATGIDTQVRVARAAVENLRPGDLAAELADGEVVVVDVREPDERAGGIIPGAVGVPRGVIEFAADPEGVASGHGLERHRRVVVYCDTGARSALVVHALYGLGFRDIAHLDGGLAAWLAEGRPVVTPSAIE